MAWPGLPKGRAAHAAAWRAWTALAAMGACRSFCFPVVTTLADFLEWPRTVRFFDLTKLVGLHSPGSTQEFVMPDPGDFMGLQLERTHQARPGTKQTHSG
jgi:hypothetical protein